VPQSVLQRDLGAVAEAEEVCTKKPAAINRAGFDVGRESITPATPTI
jgi:hypothetical protein